MWYAYCSPLMHHHQSPPGTTVNMNLQAEAEACTSKCTIDGITAHVYERQAGVKMPINVLTTLQLIMTAAELSNAKVGPAA